MVDYFVSTNSCLVAALTPLEEVKKRTSTKEETEAQCKIDRLTSPKRRGAVEPGGDWWISSVFLTDPRRRNSVHDRDIWLTGRHLCPCHLVPTELCTSVPATWFRICFLDGGSSACALISICSLTRVLARRHLWDGLKTLPP